MTPADAMQYLAKEAADLRTRDKPARAAKIEEVRELIHALSKRQAPPKSNGDFIDDVMAAFRKGKP